MISSAILVTNHGVWLQVASSQCSMLAPRAAVLLLGLLALTSLSGVSAGHNKCHRVNLLDFDIDAVMNTLQ